MRLSLLFCHVTKWTPAWPLGWVDGEWRFDETSPSKWWSMYNMMLCVHGTFSSQLFMYYSTNQQTRFQLATYYVIHQNQLNNDYSTVTVTVEPPWSISFNPLFLHLDFSRFRLEVVHPCLAAITPVASSLVSPAGLKIANAPGACTVN